MNDLHENYMKMWNLLSIITDDAIADPFEPLFYAVHLEDIQNAREFLEYLKNNKSHRTVMLDELSLHEQAVKLPFDYTVDWLESTFNTKPRC